MEFLTFANVYDALSVLASTADHATHWLDISSAVQAPDAAPVDPASTIPLAPPEGSPESVTGKNSAAEVLDMSPVTLFMKADIVVK